MVNVFSDNYRFDFFLCHSPLFLNVLIFTTKGKRKKKFNPWYDGTYSVIYLFIFLHSLNSLKG